ncbi:hypothetical protein FACS1894111_05530 [Clostridia bacterium]|nr:hypothetical protein FACS1894111_05530 [Clostridia bacterium]
MSITESIMAIGALCIALAAIWGIIERIGKPVKEINAKMDDFKRELQKIQEWQHDQQKDIEISKEENRIVFFGLQAVLDHLICRGEKNADMEKSLKEMQVFLRVRSHEGRSYDIRK